MNQDNPFATGVSINQDMVMEEGAPTIINTPHDIQETDWCINEVTFEPRTLTEMELLALGREEE